jgi:hypothetical protein
VDIPKTKTDLIDFCRTKIAECVYSQDDRSQLYQLAQNYYEYGTNSNKASLYNRTGVHIDRLGSYLYAPSDVRYAITFDATDGEPWLARASSAAKYLSREYRRADADVLFSHGVRLSLIKGCILLKHNYSEFERCLDPSLVQPEFFGVDREDLDHIADQGALCHTQWMGKQQLVDLAKTKAEKDELVEKIEKLASKAKNNPERNKWLHEVIIGGVQPVITSGTPSPSGGRVSITASPSATLSPKTSAELLRLDELWVVDNDREDYTTLQLIEGEILLEGRYKHRNLTGVKMLQPFSKICATPEPGYFWGNSEVLRVRPLQDMLSERMEDIRRLLKLQVKPPKAFIGFGGITAQKMRAAMAPGGFLQEQSPGAKIENLIPNIPQEAFVEVEKISTMFDEMGGFKPILQGEGEAGVRAGSHARTLLRTASPKLRERALYIERDAEQSAHITMELLQAKEARVFVSEKKEQFMLSQLPEDWAVEIDSHSSSPAFSDDARELAFALKTHGAISPEGLIRLTHPPMEDLLIAEARKMAEDRAKLIQQHPELLTKGKKAA